MHRIWPYNWWFPCHNTVSVYSSGQHYSQSLQLPHTYHEGKSLSNAVTWALGERHVGRRVEGWHVGWILPALRDKGSSICTRNRTKRMCMAVDPQQRGRTIDMRLPCGSSERAFENIINPSKHLHSLAWRSMESSKRLLLQWECFPVLSRPQTWASGTVLSFPKTSCLNGRKLYENFKR
jgi:hypothetical protein